MSDHSEIRQLEPSSVWSHFCDLNAVPRASKKEERVIDFMKSFGESLKLSTSVDHVGNVIIRKPATPGKEDRKTVVLQSHLDMVHQKNNDTQFDFATQGIQMLVDGDWVKAKGTTLGADNGLGVAAIMAVLASTEIPHPPLEALFTIDEETGMTGAKELKANVLTGDVMLNLDTEDDDELTIGCAGGVDVVASGDYSTDPIPDDYHGVKITVSGLTGGHSGMDIHLGRGNANKIMNRILLLAAKHCDARLVSIHGGGLRNAIPRESTATLIVPSSIDLSNQTWFTETLSAIKTEYEITDRSLEIACTTIEVISEPVSKSFQQNLTTALCGIADGIHRMSPSFAGLVQTSNNLARVQVSGGNFSVDCLTRSSINSERNAFSDSIAIVLATTGASVQKTGDYPGWQPKPNAEIVQLMKTLYEEIFDSSPKVSAGHGGLECGLLGQNYPDMQMISFGPTIRGAHSPDEKASISSTQKFWKYLVATLDRI